MTELDHIPTLEEAKAAGSPSYWWVSGWNFNRRVIAEIGIGAHIKDGAYVWVRFFCDGYSPVSGYKAADLKGIPFQFTGPIPEPTKTNANQT